MLYIFPWPSLPLNVFLQACALGPLGAWLGENMNTYMATLKTVLAAETQLEHFLECLHPPIYQISYHGADCQICLHSPWGPAKSLLCKLNFQCPPPKTSPDVSGLIQDRVQKGLPSET